VAEKAEAVEEVFTVNGPFDREFEIAPERATVLAYGECLSGPLFGPAA